MNIRFTAYMKSRIVRDYLENKDISHAMNLYSLSEEEVEAWVKNHQLFGLDGLKVTKLQKMQRMGA